MISVANVGLSTLLLAVVAMLISIMIGGLAIEVSDDVSSALVDSSEVRGDQISTDFSIISPSELDLSDSTLTIQVKNTGRVNIPVSRTTIIVNGNVVSDTSLQREVKEASPDVWAESETLTVDVDLASSDIDASSLCNSENDVEVTANQRSDILTFFADC